MPRLLRALAIAVALALAVAPAAHAVSFGKERRASSAYAWNPGKSLAASDTRLLSVWASDCPPPKGICATDAGPRMGVFVMRSPAPARPPSWSSAFRLSPKGVQAERPSIAAEGGTVIASWVTQRSYVRYRASGPRVLWVRVSTSEGKTWRAPIRLTSIAGRVDYPRVAIADGRLFAVWTNADTGGVRLAYSDDLGKAWTSERVGSTTSLALGAKEGYAGLPDVGGSGANVAVAWIASDTGGQQLATSSNGGADLAGATPTQLTAASPNDGQHYPAVGGTADPADPRVLIAYSTANHIEVRHFDGAVLAAPSTAFTWKQQTAGVRYDGGYGPAVLPVATTGVAIATAACRPNPRVPNPCNPLAKGARIDVLFRLSSDGSSWDDAVRLTASGGPFDVADEPSIAATGGPVYRIAYDHYERRFTRYAVALRSGA